MQSATAEIWRVDPDGGGDFLTIQSAIDASNPGDVIELAPGRYIDHTPRGHGGQSVVALAYVDVDDLTIRGDNRNTVIIGPTEEFDLSRFVSSVGILGAGAATLTIESLTIENVDFSVSAFTFNFPLRLQSLTIVDCRLRHGPEPRGGFAGVYTDAPEFSLISSEVVGITVGVEMCGHFDPTVNIVECDFRDNGLALRLSGARSALIESCDFVDNGGAMSLDYVNGEVRDCEIDSLGRGIDLHRSSTVTLTDTSIRSAGTSSFSAYGNSHVVGTGNSFSGGTEAVLRFFDSTADLTGGHILRDGVEWSVHTYSDPNNGVPYTVNLANNFWGTEDPAEIAAAILDSHDDPTILGTVVFEPFSANPVSSSQSSFGSFKARFTPR